MPFEYTWKIRSGDTDFSGLIYTPEVVDCLVEGLQDLMAAAGYSQQRALDEGVLYPAVHAEADYREPIRIEDVVHVDLTPSIGDTSVTFHGIGTVDETTAFEGEITIAFIDDDSNSVPVPEAVREGLDPYVDGDSG